MQTHIIQKIITLEKNIDTKKKLQLFLGLVNQVREYIPKLAEHLKPLHRILKKDVEYYFDNKDKEHKKTLRNYVKNYQSYIFLMKVRHLHT